MLDGVPLALADHDTQPFWDGCNEGRLLLPHCRDCGACRWPPGPMCPSCQGTDTNWTEWAGVGKVYSWVVVHHAPRPALAEQVPYIIALVELLPKIRILANVTDCVPEEMAADLPLELFFEDVGDGERLPNFRRSR